MTIDDTLSLRAGPAALAHIRDNGFNRDHIGALAGAAGGPKWLILSALDQYIFGEWLADAPQTLQLIGSSVGAWRFAAACHPHDPAAAIARLEAGYLAQRYSDDAGRAEITRVIRGILERFFDDAVLDGVVNHPRYRLNAITVRSRSLMASERRGALAGGAALVALANLTSRRGHGTGFERVVFAHPRADVRWAGGRKPASVPLSADNARDAVFASGSVPLMMDGVRDPAGAMPGLYRDGGIADYHIDQPVVDSAGHNPVVLMPHYTDRLIPGWFDKSLKWRRPRHAANTLMVGPSARFMASLPNGRVPDRKDFFRYDGDVDARLRDWQASLDAGKRMRDAFAAFVESDDPARYVQPL